MLLVDHDQAEVADRREDRRAGPDADPRLARAQTHPLVEARARRQSRVKHGDLLAEALAEACEGLGSERDLRHEHDRRAPRASAASTASR